MLSSGQGVRTHHRRTAERVAVDIPPGCITSGILLRRHSTRMSHIRNSAAADIPPGCFTSGILTPDGRGERFNFPGHTYPDPLIALTWRVSQSFCTVPRCSPEAPDMSNRHFEIFCFRYLLSKSLNSPCNPPIIGFLSY